MGASPSFRFSFTPDYEGDFETRVTPLYVNATTAHPVVLRGKGKARQEVGGLALGNGGYLPPIEPFPKNRALDFGTVPVGGNRYKSIFVRNTNPNPKTVKVIVRPAGPFSVSESSGGPVLQNFTIGADDGTYVVVTFYSPCGEAILFGSDFRRYRRAGFCCNCFDGRGRQPLG